ncbi:MAG: NAD(P)H-hydrate dehydratase [Candidatus Bathyarchaeia archaeon]
METDVISSRKMRALEMNAEYFGISLLQLMENAGCSIAAEILTRFSPKKTRVAFFCGLGGNGGDGFVAARHLHSLGYQVEVIVGGKPTNIMHEASLKNWSALQSLRNCVQLHEVVDSSQIPDVKADVVVDALLGVGLRGAPRQPILQLIRTINGLQAFKLAVDSPTGLDSDSGEVLGEAVKADLTVTFHKAKRGLLNAKEYVGELLVKDIGVPKTFESFAGPGDVALAVKPRLAESHKGDFGKLLIVGGSETYSGAPALVALAALRTGVDIAYVAAPEKTAYAISSTTPNLITIKLGGNHLNPENVSQISQYLRRITTLVLGPGLGLHTETKKAVEKIVAAAEETKTPLLLDADGLQAFAEFKRPLKVPTVLTPHTGEYEILTGKRLPSNIDERVEKVKKTALKLGAVVLLKGNKDIISDGKRVKLNFTGNPGMTVGGTGDVLSGIVGAFMAQQADPFEAAAAGAFTNGAAGDFARNERGYHMVATDLLDWIPKVIDDPMSHLKVRDGAS